VDTVSRCTTSYLLAGPAVCPCLTAFVVEFTHKDFVCPLCAMFFLSYVKPWSKNISCKGRCVFEKNLPFTYRGITCLCLLAWWVISLYGGIFHFYNQISILTHQNPNTCPTLGWGTFFQFSSPCNGNTVFPIFLPFLPVEKSFSK
jgi:hypothetical protein